MGTHQGHRWHWVPHLVNGKYAVADHFCFGVDKGGEDKARRVTQTDIIFHQQCLQGDGNTLVTLTTSTISAPM